MWGSPRFLVGHPVVLAVLVHVWAHADVVLLAGIGLVVECSQPLVKGIPHHMRLSLR